MLFRREKHLLCLAGMKLSGIYPVNHLFKVNIIDMGKSTWYLEAELNAGTSSTLFRSKIKHISNGVGGAINCPLRLDLLIDMSVN